jgi:hypothetical protein
MLRSDDMTYNEFVKKYLGKAVDYDGVSGVQCVDLAKLYIDKVIGVKPKSIGDAYCYWDDFNETYLKKYFTRVKYKKGVKSQKGDLVVWGKKYNGSSRYGHIAIATGDQSSKNIITYDENFGEKEMRRVTHTLKGISGFLRPIDQKNIASAPKIANGNYKLTAVRGVYHDWGSKSGRKQVSQLTPNGKKCATKKSGDAYLKKGTKVTVEKTKLIKSGNLWAQIPSGYICIWECKDNELFVKKY